MDNINNETIISNAVKEIIGNSNKRSIETIMEDKETDFAKNKKLKLDNEVITFPEATNEFSIIGNSQTTFTETSLLNLTIQKDIDVDTHIFSKNSNIDLIDKWKLKISETEDKIEIISENNLYVLLSKCDKIQETGIIKNGEKRQINEESTIDSDFEDKHYNKEKKLKNEVFNETPKLKISETKCNTVIIPDNCYVSLTRCDKIKEMEVIKNNEKLKLKIHNKEAENKITSETNSLYKCDKVVDIELHENDDCNKSKEVSNEQRLNVNEKESNTVIIPDYNCYVLLSKCDEFEEVKVIKNTEKVQEISKQEEYQKPNEKIIENLFKTSPLINEAKTNDNTKRKIPGFIDKVNSFFKKSTCNSKLPIQKNKTTTSTSNFKKEETRNLSTLSDSKANNNSEIFEYKSNSKLKETDKDVPDNQKQFNGLFTENKLDLSYRIPFIKKMNSVQSVTKENLANFEQYTDNTQLNIKSEALNTYVVHVTANKNLPNSKILSDKDHLQLNQSNITISDTETPLLTGNKLIDTSQISYEKIAKEKLPSAEVSSLQSEQFNINTQNMVSLIVPDNKFMNIVDDGTNLNALNYKVSPNPENVHSNKINIEIKKGILPTDIESSSNCKMLNTDTTKSKENLGKFEVVTRKEDLYPNIKTKNRKCSKSSTTKENFINYIRKVISSNPKSEKVETKSSLSEDNNGNSKKLKNKSSKSSKSSQTLKDANTVIPFEKLNKASTSNTSITSHAKPIPTPTSVPDKLEKDEFLLNSYFANENQMSDHNMHNSLKSVNDPSSMDYFNSVRQQWSSNVMPNPHLSKSVHYLNYDIRSRVNSSSTSPSNDCGGNFISCDHFCLERINKIDDEVENTCHQLRIAESNHKQTNIKYINQLQNQIDFLKKRRFELKKNLEEMRYANKYYIGDNFNANFLTYKDYMELQEQENVLSNLRRIYDS